MTRQLRVADYEKKKERLPDLFAWTGFSSAFKIIGITEVAGRSERRPILRIVK